MLRVGLSGGIGSGKSTVAGRLVEHGALVLDADAIAREVVQPETDGLQRVVAAFGDDVLARDGSLDRQALAGKVFADSAARATLNGILHPLIGQRTAELMAQAPPGAIVVHDVPLLVENHLVPSYHLVLMVHAPEDVRVRRLVSSRGIAEDDARARIAAQATEAQRREVTDVPLDNGGRPDEVLSIVDSLWTDRLVPYEANVRLRRAGDPGPVVLAPPDPDWPAAARRLAARITAACGDAVSRVDHIGSTSIPDMPAKDVIDLQVSVPSLAEADRIRPLLDDAGFAHRPELIQDTPHGANADPQAWTKRVHCACDPGRPANVHVRVTGGPGWRYALLLRDWLRADEAARADYLALKEKLAAEHAGAPTAGYAEAKEPWFAAGYERSERWAAQTGWLPPV